MMRAEFIILACWIFGPLIMAAILSVVWREPKELPEPPPRPINPARVAYERQRAQAALDFAEWEKEVA